jgi:cytidylate kinase
MDGKIIITIGRQFGSGGSEIGRKLAEPSGIADYDRELLAVAARESGLCPEVFEKADEQASRGFACAFPMGFSYSGIFMPYNDILSNEKLFELQSDAIRKIAEKESCILVGRCADYILRDNPDCLSFFIHNDIEIRTARIVERQGVTPPQARELIRKTDRTRAAYYNYYTNKIWGVASSYHFSIDASVLGIDETVALMKEFIDRKRIQSRNN